MKAALLGAVVLALALVDAGCNGKRTSAPPAAAPDEHQLFTLVDAVPACDEPHAPRALIDAVNALQALGHDRALATLEAYAQARQRETSPCGGAFLVVRTLFDVPDPPGYLPPMMVGAPEPPAPDDPRKAPRFPIVLVEDVPFRIVSGYMLGGKAEAFADHLAAVARVAKVRSAPLAPPADVPALVERIAGTPGTAFLRDHNLDDDAGRARIREQGLR